MLLINEFHPISVIIDEAVKVFHLMESTGWFEKQLKLKELKKEKLK